MLQVSQGAHEVQGERTVHSFLTLCPQDNLEFPHFPEEETGLRKARPQVTYTVSVGAGADLESEHAGVQVVLVPTRYQY